MQAYTEIQKLAGWMDSNPTSPVIPLIIADIKLLDYEEDLVLFESRCNIGVRKAIEAK